MGSKITTGISFGEINTAIITGEFDEDLQLIIDSCKRRQQYANRRSLDTGDTVEVVQGRPRYLIGERAKVERVNQTTVTIKFIRPVGRFRTGVRCPIEWVKKVEEE